MNKDTIQNTIKALEIEANLISNGQSDKKNYNRLKNVINEWFYLKTAQRTSDTMVGCKFSIGDIVVNRLTEIVKDVVPQLQKKSLATVITRFNGMTPCDKPENPPIVSRNEYTVILIDKTKNILVDVVDMIESDIKYDYEIAPIAPAVVLSTEDLMSKRLLMNINAKYNGKKITKVEFDTTSRAALLKFFVDKNIGEYNLVQFRIQQQAPGGPIELIVSNQKSTETKASLGVPPTSILLAFSVEGSIDTDSGIYTINKFVSLKTPASWQQQGGNQVGLKLQVIMEVISGPAITAEVDASTLSATSDATVDPAAAAAAAATATSTAGP
jgi:hypothetical protein